MHIFKQLIGILILGIFFSCNVQTKKIVASQAPPLTIELASLEVAKKLLVTEDAYTKAWSRFDIDSKSTKIGSTRAEYFDHIIDQTLEWTEQDRQKLNASFQRIKKSIKDQQFNLTLDDPVAIVKTTSKEEGGALGYTRGSYIVLTQNVSEMDENGIDRLLAHELFHVISRNKSELREKLYNLIGFKMMNEVPYPDVLLDYRITNPDATQTDSYINLEVDGVQMPCMMILYSDRPYEGGSFFNYMNVGFLRLEGEEIKKAVIGDQGPEIYTIQEVSGFFEQVKRNTNYIIHADEILADNFTFALFGKEGGLENPELVESIKAVLQKSITKI